MPRHNARSNRSAKSTATGKITTSAALVGVGAIAISSVGVADAATGGKFILGHKNSANKITTLTNSKGTALGLTSKKGTPPLAVSNSTLIKRLNANFLGGLSSSQLQRRVTGSCATGIKSIGSTGASTCASAQEMVFTSSGSFTVPAGISHLTGDFWGAGGGGGYVLGGAGSGAFERVVLNVSPGDVVHVTVGTAGHGVSGSNGTNGGDSTLSINSGSVIAGAGGGQGGAYPCAAVNGGTPTAPTAPAVGLDSKAGDGGDCGVIGGKPGFAGAGGANYGGTGTDGLVIISLDH